MVINSRICRKKQDGYISFSGLTGESFDSRLQDRTHERYQKSFDQDDKKINNRYRLIEDSLGEIKKSRKRGDRDCGGRSRLRRQNPLQVRCSHRFRL
jgi:hypothetical protein